MEIIGLSGYARSGKDEAAKVLVEEFGFIRVAFADKLRDFLYALNPMVSQDVRLCSELLRDGGEPITSTIYVQDVIDRVGWDGYKDTKLGPEVRRLLQRLGTEAGRETMWDSIWIDAAFAGLPDDAKVVVTDARFENEAQAIKNRGGKIWRITREGVGPAVMPDGTIHRSETGLDNWKFDYHLWNNTTLYDYRQDVRSVMEMYRQDTANWKKALG